ncbi:MAG: helix-turn-helix domain-containing protein [Ruminococcus flavefaciens]|nr:helix-turn-helix domain-containing protein [Ruminococcus flavefaciens]MCM1231372.1 helix-turn-helix domain-containing protein [Ruminococcus flavefaciens]
MNLGERYKNLRLALTGKDGEPMSAKEFAKDVVGLATTRVSELENNKREMSLTELKAYHNGLGVSFEYLLGETDTMTISEDIQTACKVTGLTERAMTNLIINKEEIIKVVNFIFENEMALMYKLTHYFNAPIDNSQWVQITEKGELVEFGAYNMSCFDVKVSEIVEKVLLDDVFDCVIRAKELFDTMREEGDDNG